MSNRDFRHAASAMALMAALAAQSSLAAEAASSSDGQATAAPASAQVNPQEQEGSSVGPESPTTPAAAGDTKPPAENEIVVTGTHLASTGFTAPTPVTVVGAQQIQQEAATNIADVLGQLPSFRAQSTPATTAIYINNAGANLADLRGLGANRTLVLVDGRRFVAGTTSGGGFSPSGAVDLNMIPTSLIKRTEVVTGGASANYGSDAVAGVVNLILDTDLTGIRGTVQKGISSRGDNSDIYLSLAGGTPFADGRGHFVIGGEYDNNKGVGGCYSRSWCAEAYNTIPVVGPARAANNLPAQVILPNTLPVATWGGVITSGPLRGVAFAPNGSIYQHDFGTFYGAGIFQSGGGEDPQNAFYNGFPLVAPVKRFSLMAHISYQVTDNIEAFVEGNYADVKATTIGAQPRFVGPQIVIRRDNAYISPELATLMDANGVTSFVLNRIGEDFGHQTGLVTRNLYRGVVGLKGDINADWHWDAYYQYGETDYHQEGNNVAITGNPAIPLSGNFYNAVDAVRDPSTGNIVCRTTLTNPTNPYVQGCVPINIFGQGNWNPAAKSYAFGNAVQDTKLTQNVAALNLRGDLFHLPGGPFAVAFGAEYRVEDVSGTADPVSSQLRFYTSPGSGISGPAIKVKEGYIEVGAPILADVPFAHTLSLNGAYRYTDYSTSGGVSTWKVGAVWEPVRQLRLRVTRSRDIRAPNFFELYNPTVSSFQNVFDPLNGGQQFLVSTRSGGNPDLQPEKADTFTAGVVISPIGNLRLSLDYYDITLYGAISTVGAQTIVTGCAQGHAAYCNFVQRDSAGMLAIVTNPYLNVSRLKSRGLDIEGSYNTRVGPGDLSVRALATRLFKYDPIGDGRNRAGMNGSPVSVPSGLPKWNVNGYLTYSLSPVTAGVEVRYISPGIYNIALIGPGQAGYDPSLPNSVSNNHVPARTYVNLNASVDVLGNGPRKVQVFGVVDNLFDVDPPNQMPSSFAVTNPALYDVIGRTFRFGVRFAY
jgi:outer membrane receptor protein involved in Fe transport